MHNLMTDNSLLKSASSNNPHLDEMNVKHSYTLNQELKNAYGLTDTHKFQNSIYQA